MADAGWSGLFGGYRGKNFGNQATEGQAGGNMLGDFSENNAVRPQELGVQGGGWDAGGGALGPVGGMPGQSDVTDIHGGYSGPSHDVAAISTPLNAPHVPGSGGFAKPRWAQSQENAVNAVNDHLAMANTGNAAGFTNAGSPPITTTAPNTNPPYDVNNPPGGGPFSGLPAGGTNKPYGANGPFGYTGDQPVDVNKLPANPVGVPKMAPGPSPTYNPSNLPPNDMGGGAGPIPTTTNPPNGGPFAGLPPGGTNKPYGANGPFG